jgi:ribosomal protein S6
MNKYEAMLIIRPSVAESDAEKMSTSLKSIIKDVENFVPI